MLGGGQAEEEEGCGGSLSHPSSSFSDSIRFRFLGDNIQFLDGVVEITDCLGISKLNTNPYETVLVRNIIQSFDLNKIIQTDVETWVDLTLVLLRHCLLLIYGVCVCVCVVSSVTLLLLCHSELRAEPVLTSVVPDGSRVMSADIGRPLTL